MQIATFAGSPARLERAFKAAPLAITASCCRSTTARRSGSNGGVPETISLAKLNALAPEAFEQVLAGIFEHSSWIAGAVAPQRPFETVEDLHAAMVRVMTEADETARLALLRAHPDLAPPSPEAQAGLTAASAAEQSGLGLDRLPADDAAWMAALNRAYRERFGFPFIIAVRGQKDRQAILAALLARLDNPAGQEQRTALEEVSRIARFRLDDLVTGPGSAHPEIVPQGWLSVHVLDTARGAPAAGLTVRLDRIDGGAHHRLGSWNTDADGRVPGRLLEGAAMLAGIYEVVFDVAAWRGDDAGFYDLIPIRFRLDDPDQHYHIPLLLAPFGYSTYRGS